MPATVPSPAPPSAIAMAMPRLVQFYRVTSRWVIGGGRVRRGGVAELFIKGYLGGQGEGGADLFLGGILGG